MNAAREEAIQRLEDEHSDSLGLATLLAFLSPDPIPIDLLETAVSKIGGSGEPTAASLLKDLERESLVAVEGKTVLLTRAVASTLRERLEDDVKRDWAARAVRLLAEAYPPESDDVRQWDRCAELTPHALAAIDYAEAFGFRDREVLELLGRAADFECSKGSFDTAHALAQRALAVASSTLEGDDRLLSELHRTAGSVHASRGASEAALREHERALAIARSSSPLDDPLVLSELASLCYLQLELGREVDVEEDLLRALDMRQGQPPVKEVYVAWGAIGWARLQHRDRDPEGARSAYETALSLAERVVGPEHPDTAEMKGGLGVALEACGSLPEAREQLEAAVRIQAEALGSEHPDVAVQRSNLASVLQELGDFAGAKEQLELALRAGEATLPPDHRGLWIRHRKLSAVAYTLRDFEVSLEHAEWALEISRRSQGPSEPRVAGDLSSAAETLLMMGRSDEAVDKFRHALEILERGYGDEHDETAAAHSALGRALKAANRYREAQDHFRRALSIYEATRGPEDARASRARVRLVALAPVLVDEIAGALDALGSDQEASSMRDAAAQALEKVLRAELDRGDGEMLLTLAAEARHTNPSLAQDALQRAEDEIEDGVASSSRRRKVAVAWYDLAKEQERRGETEAAVESYRRSDRLVAGVPSFEAIVLHELATLLLNSDRPEEAAEQYRLAADRRREGLQSGGTQLGLASSLSRLGRTLAGLERYDDALEAFREELDVLAALSEPERQIEGVVLHDIGDALRELGQLEEAASSYRLAAKRKREGLEGGDNQRDLAATLLELGRTSLALGEHEPALSALEERLEILLALEERDPQAEGVTLHDLGVVYSGREEDEKAAQLYDRAVQRKKEAQGAGGVPHDLAVSLFALGRASEAAHSYEAALRAYQEQLEILAGLPDRDPRAEGTALHDIGDVLRAMNQTKEAADSYTRAAERKREGLSAGGKSRDLATTLLQLGRTRLALSEFDAARAAHEERLEILRQLEEPEPQAEGLTLHDLGDVAHAEGNYGEAVRLYEQAARQKRKAQGGDGSQRDLAVTLLALGRSREAMQDYGGALEAYREQLEILSSADERDRRSEGVAHRDIGDAYRGLGRTAEALESYERALAILRTDADTRDERLLLAETLLSCGAVQRELDPRSAASKEAASEALGLIGDEGGPILRVSALMLLGEQALAAGDHARAVSVFAEANSLVDGLEGGDPLDLAAARTLLSAAQAADGQDSAADESRAGALQALDRAFRADAIEARPDHVLRLWGLSTEVGEGAVGNAILSEVRARVERDPADSGASSLLSDLLLRVGRELELGDKDYPAARAAYEERLAVLLAQPERDLYAEGVTLHDIADALRAQGQLGQAVEHYRRAVERKSEAEENATGSLIELASTELEIGDSDSAARHAAEAQQDLEKLDQAAPGMLAAALEVRGRSALATDDPGQAVRFLEEAAGLLSESDRGGDRESLESIQTALGEARSSLGAS